MRIQLVLFFLMTQLSAFAQMKEGWWHGKERKVHYLPQGNDFICANPVMRFNRALYGTNTAFRVEAGDLPEFALYMPGMGGNLQFGLQKEAKHKWLIRADKIKTVYRPGSMIYTISDSLLGKGSLQLTVLALADAEGMVIQVSGKNIPADVKLVWIYGGASGKKFSRDGDIGADPESSFYLKPENCTDNSYQLSDDKFILNYGTGKVLTEEERYEIQTKPESQLTGEAIKNARQITGIYPEGSVVKLINANNKEEAFTNTKPAIKNPCISGSVSLTGEAVYMLLHNTATVVLTTPARAFTAAEDKRKQLVDRVTINTPDPYLNTLGGALAIAADAIWESPTYMHGAVAWRMRLPGWRGAYTADPLGWHDRARAHFEAYAKSQLTTPSLTGVVMDTALNLARHLEKVGTQLFSEGYITRNPNGYVGAHHYDMNLVFTDQLLNHFHYTGDTAFVKRMWLLLKRHLAWEKKNFDADGDGLYDAYAAIWASDALQYSGGGVTHSSAYNYRANREAAALAKLIGEDGTMYEAEAAKILKAINEKLWMPDKGWYAEYKDLLGNQLLHPAAGLWTIYHAIDSKVPDAFQAYRSLRYIDNHIPHIPVKATGWSEKDLYLLSETNWQPYTWSLNNVVFSENLHTALAYWQGNRKEEAFTLWRSAVLETMYLSSGPGNFQQLSFYDAIRGELYRDFADGIGMMARSLVEGLFGIEPDALHQSIRIKPGFPAKWKNASLNTPDISFSFTRTKEKETYSIRQNQPKLCKIELNVPVYRDQIAAVTLNGKPVKWTIVKEAMAQPQVVISIPAMPAVSVSVITRGSAVRTKPEDVTGIFGKAFSFSLPGKKIISVKEAPGNWNLQLTKTGKVHIPYPLQLGEQIVFCKVQQGQLEWWQPVHVFVTFNWKTISPLNYNSKAGVWPQYTKVNLSPLFNEKVNQIFSNKYLSPRPVSPTLQLPVQGIGNWAYHSVSANINDSGLRRKAIKGDSVVFNDIPFSTPSSPEKNNIVFVSMWDNYPDSVVIPVSGNAKAAHLLMTGSTNPMQSRITNGVLVFNYSDGSADSLELTNPENWWPIEQDYYKDDYAFDFYKDIRGRVLLKTGELIDGDYKYSSIRGFTNRAIDGGAATLLDCYLDEKKELKSIVLRAIANDVVIGLMSVTLEK